MKIFLNMLVGKLDEDFLEQSLKSLDFVNHTVINLNGDNDKNKDIITSLDVKKNITIFTDGFRSFSWNRNKCLDYSQDADWIIQADPDEVFYEKLKDFCKKELPKIDKQGYNRVFSYYIHLMKSLETCQNAGGGIDGMYYKCFMFKNIFKWRNPDHERLCGAKRFKDYIIPDIMWFHYGYIDAVKVFEKWQIFAEAEGQPNRYKNYFKDPNAPWRTDPSKILDDRPTFRPQFPPPEIMYAK